MTCNVAAVPVVLGSFALGGVVFARRSFAADVKPS
jgi:hypothetical protein